MSVFRLVRFYLNAKTHASADADALRAAGDDGDSHLTYHKRIVLTAAIFGGIGLLLGGLIAIKFAVAMIEKPMNASVGKQIALVIACFLGFGFVWSCLGMSISCLFAPRAFLEGPLEKKWMRVIGTKSIGQARAICGLVALILVACLPAIAVFFLFYVGSGSARL